MIVFKHHVHNPFLCAKYFTHLITIDTTDVQSASVEELDNSSLLLKCVFAEGSSARGCQLTIQLSHSGKVLIVVQLHRSNDSLEVVELYEHEVVWGMSPALVARDIEADGNTADRGIPGTVRLISTTTRSHDCKDEVIDTKTY